MPHKNGEPPLSGAERQRRYRQRLREVSPGADIVVTPEPEPVTPTVTSDVTVTNDEGSDAEPGHENDIGDEAFDLFVVTRPVTRYPWWAWVWWGSICTVWPPDDLGRDLVCDQPPALRGPCKCLLRASTQTE
jgi:hypothetical protein